MNLKNLLAATALTSAAALAPAHAAVFIFDGDETATPKFSPIDAPVNGGNVRDCNSTRGSVSDLCTDDDAAGFVYSKDGIEFTVTATTGATDGVGGMLTTAIQDLIDDNQGLGVLSDEPKLENITTQDQINFATGEALTLDFGSLIVNLKDIWVNNGVSEDCPDPGEGGCGGIGIIVDGVSQTFDNFLANGVVATGASQAVKLTGSVFTFFADEIPGFGDNFGYSVERITVNEVPVPGALPLLLSGVAGLGFASRRRKKVA